MRPTTYQETVEQQRKLLAWDRWRIASKINKHFKLNCRYLSFCWLEDNIYVCYADKDGNACILKERLDLGLISFLNVKEDEFLLVDLEQEPENPGELTLFVNDKDE